METFVVLICLFYRLATGWPQLSRPLSAAFVQADISFGRFNRACLRTGHRVIFV